MKRSVLRLLTLLLTMSMTAGCPDQRFDDDDSEDDDDSSDDDDSGDDDDTDLDDDDASDDDDVLDDDDSGSDDDDVLDDDDTLPPSPCDEAIARQTNIGCEFWAVDLDNAENFVDNAAGGQFAVAVANAHDTLTSHVEIHINVADQGLPIVEQLVDQADIPAGELHVFNLPRRDVDGENITPNVDDGPQTWLSSRAFRITSDAPVVVYQFNTLDQQVSNDASLLLPIHSLGLDHIALTYTPSGPIAFAGNRGYVTVVGVHPGTEVDVTPVYDILDGLGVSAVSAGVGIEAGTTRSFDIGTFDVLNLETTFMELTFPPGPEPDLTGTTVTSNLPVAVFVGTDLSLIETTIFNPDACCAEHLEEQVPPIRALRSNYVVSHSAKRSTSATWEYDVYRVLASGVGTTVTTSLPTPDDTFTLAPGEFREFYSQTGFVVESTAPVLLAQYLVAGGDLPAGLSGDSSLMYVPPVAQRLDSYIFTTGQGFSSNHVVISMVEGTVAAVDGTELSLAGCAGPMVDGVYDAQTYQSWTCDIADGAHSVSADAPVAIYVYGYYNAGSYAYAGGASLQ